MPHYNLPLQHINHNKNKRCINYDRVKIATWSGFYYMQSFFCWKCSVANQIKLGIKVLHWVQLLPPEKNSPSAVPCIKCSWAYCAGQLRWREFWLNQSGKGNTHAVWKLKMQYILQQPWGCLKSFWIIILLRCKKVIQLH